MKLTADQLSYLNAVFHLGLAGLVKDDLKTTRFDEVREIVLGIVLPLEERHPDPDEFLDPITEQLYKLEQAAYEKGETASRPLMKDKLKLI